MPYKIILYSSLFPSPWNPFSGLFVAELATSLSTMAGISVVSPVIAHRQLTRLWKIPRKHPFSDRINVWAPIVFNFPKVLK